MKKIVLLLISVISSPVVADAGVWTIPQLTKLDGPLKPQGWPVDIHSASDLGKSPLATVATMAGCAAVFVSPRGLLVSNQQCSASAWQTLPVASGGTQGFIASSPSQELPLNGISVKLTLSIDNVTQAIVQELAPQMQGRDRQEQIQALQKELIAQCEMEPGVRCDVYSMQDGAEYHLVKSIEIRDVRLVYQPAAALDATDDAHNVGQWPRYSSDVGFYRAYVGQDGLPADYSPQNVPFSTASHADIALQGVRAGEPVIVAGFPAQSQRQLSALELQQEFTERLPSELASARLQLQALAQQDTADTTWRYSPLRTSLQRSSRLTEQALADYQQQPIQQQYQHAEQQFLSWLQAEPARMARFLPAVKQLQQLQIQQAELAGQQRLLQRLHQISMLDAGRVLYRYAKEQEKEDVLRAIGYQQRDEPSLRLRLNALSNGPDTALEQVFALQLINEYAALPAAQRLPAFDTFFQLEQGFVEDKVRAQLTSMYQTTGLVDAATRLDWLHKSATEMDESADAMLQFAARLYATERHIDEEHAELQGRIAAVSAKVVAARQAFEKSQGRLLSYDANGTLRVSFGKVQGYSPADGIYHQPFSTVQGIAARHAATSSAGKSQLDVIAKRQFGPYVDESLATVPVNYLSTADTALTPSGATFNAQGQLVGLVVDNLTSGALAAYIPAQPQHRAIHLDMRYVLWRLDKVDAAAALLKELSVTAPTANEKDT